MRSAWLICLVGLAASAAEPFPDLKDEARARIQNLEQSLSDWQLADARKELV